MQQFPSPDNDRFLRIWQICGDPKRNAEPIFPISRAAWWAGVAEGRYPAGILLSPRTRVWRASDIKALVASISAEAR
jgi:predicted DNA-binding transcriptional regulator AlpA